MVIIIARTMWLRFRFYGVIINRLCTFVTYWDAILNETIDNDRRKPFTIVSWNRKEPVFQFFPF